jgi:hypothetical protein
MFSGVTDRKASATADPPPAAKDDNKKAMTTKKGEPILFGDDGEKGEVHGERQAQIPFGNDNKRQRHLRRS